MSDRKYRQRGYMSEEERARAGRKKGPRRDRGAPRGRGLGRPSQSVFRCARCGNNVAVIGELEAKATCGECGADLHTCTNCRSFDPGARFQCRQPLDEPVGNKSANNECELFEPKLVQVHERKTGSGGKGNGTSGESPDEAREAFDALFDL